jgi:UDP-3-O-[3-hydroxymyristoyl] N-acetylglucosamine deacetylase
MKKDPIRFDSNPQTTIARKIEFNGVGLFTGDKVKCVINPALPNTGIVFERSDLPMPVQINADIHHAQSGARWTMLKTEHAQIYTVEHLLSALYGLGIDNAFIQVHGPEIPIGDGSADHFISELKKTEVIPLDAQKKILFVDQPIYVREGNSLIIALPSETMEIAYTLSYPNYKLLRAQHYSFTYTLENYEKEIASSRTFSRYEDLLPLWEKGLLKHAGLENGVVIKEDMILNPEGLRFHNEMARHKILDIIGDLSLIGMRICAHIIALKSGHALNLRLVKKLEEVYQSEGVSYAAAK